MKTSSKEKAEVTLESLGLECEIVSNGIGNLGDGPPMLKWEAMFRTKRGFSEAFTYYTGTGLVPWGDKRVVAIAKTAINQPIYSQFKGMTSEGARVVEMGSRRHAIADQSIVARAAQSVAFITKWKPNPIEILWSVAMDSGAIDQSFEDWASDFGYDTDSRKAEATYRACQDNGHKLMKLLSREQIQEIRELEL